MRRIFQECKIGQGNANLLLEALSYARPQDLEKEFIQVRFVYWTIFVYSGKAVIQEFQANCRASQQLIIAYIPRANVDAQRSRSPESLSQLNRRPSQTGPGRRTIQTREDGSPIDLTIEEDLLAALVATDEALQEALRVYDNLERVAKERQAEELSRRFVSMERRVS
jgi:hypothetical protein